MRIHRVVTRVGDGGSTQLVGGQRVSKASLRVHAYGEVKLAAIRLLRVVNLGGTAVGTGLAVTRLGSPPAIPVENRHA